MEQALSRTGEPLSPHLSSARLKELFAYKDADMGRFHVAHWTLLLSICCMCGCASSSSRNNPFAWMKRSTDQALAAANADKATDKTKDKRSDASNPFKNRAIVKKDADKKSSTKDKDDNATKLASADAKATKTAKPDATSADNAGKTTTRTHTAETLAQLEEELKHYPPEERARLNKEFKDLEPAMVRMVLSNMRMMRQMNKQAAEMQLAQAGALSGANGAMASPAGFQATQQPFNSLNGFNGQGSYGAAAAGGNVVGQNPDPAAAAFNDPRRQTFASVQQPPIQQPFNQMSQQQQQGYGVAAAGVYHDSIYRDSPPAQQQLGGGATATGPLGAPANGANQLAMVQNYPAGQPPANYPQQPAGQFGQPPVNNNPFAVQQPQPGANVAGMMPSGGQQFAMNAPPGSGAQQPNFAASGAGAMGPNNAVNQAYLQNGATTGYPNGGQQFPSGSANGWGTADGYASTAGALPAGYSDRVANAQFASAQPSAGNNLPPGWREDLERLIASAEAVVARSSPGTTEAERQAYLEQHVFLRMLYLMADQPRALEAIRNVEGTEQEFWQQIFWALSNYFDNKVMPEQSDRATQTVAQLRSAVQRLQENARLELRNANFCQKITSFGNYEKFPRDEFIAGRPVLVYAEVENFKSELTSSGQFRTSLCSTVEIYPAGKAGTPVKTMTFPPTEDLCRNYRRDYFHAYEFTIPSNLEAGPYVMKLRVEDKLSKKVAEYSLNFTVSGT